MLITIDVQGSPGNGSYTDVAKMMQNLNKMASKSTSKATERKQSTVYQYHDDYTEDDDSDFDVDEDLEDDESEAEDSPEEKERQISEGGIRRRRTADPKFDIEQIRASFVQESAEEATENETGGDTSGGEINEFVPRNINQGNIEELRQHLNFEIDEDVDSENLISDEEDDNESGFLSQM